MARLIQTPDTFFVQEIPLIKTTNEGNHLFVTFSRRGMSTFFAASKLKKILKIKEEEIGIAGNKDRHSTAVQTFSLPARLEPKILKAFEQLGIKIISAELHHEKLRMGQISGNKFKIILEIDSKEEFENLSEKLKECEEKGFPNYFGPQRVSDEETIKEGKKLFLNKSLKKGARKDRFIVSVFQSVVFNSYLYKRIENKIYHKLLLGDVVRMGEKIVVMKEILEKKNIFTKECVLTGPIIGSKMTLPFGESLSFEKEVIEGFGISFEDIFLARATGGRRDCASFPKDIQARELSENKMEVNFTLKSGCYATTLLNHIGVKVTLPVKM